MIGTSFGSPSSPVIVTSSVFGRLTTSRFHPNFFSNPVSKACVPLISPELFHAGERLVCDTLKNAPLSEIQQADLYEVICGCYERHSTIITSSHDFAEWQEVFTNPLMGSAAMDRLVYRAIRITIEGKSYRLQSFVESVKFLTREAETSTEDIVD